MNPKTGNKIRKVHKGTLSRIVFLALAAVLELLFIYFLFKYFNERASWIEGALRIISVIVVLEIVNYSHHLSSDMIWIIMIVISPIFGTIAYLLIGGNLFLSRTYRNIQWEAHSSHQYFMEDEAVQSEMDQRFDDYKGQFHYISDIAGYPFYRNNECRYFGFGEESFSVMLQELRKAERFIFMEYFIIEEGYMWNSILEILEEKVQQGVEVRVMYDDVGSIMTLSQSYADVLEAKGIKCVTFNRVNPFINVIMNHRDHRKILVIDGKVGFTGGINLADEYLNIKKRFGVWKDNCLLIRGNAVWSMTITFLSNWNALRKEDYDYARYRHIITEDSADGYIAPYADTPLDDELVGQYIYMNIINQARDYVYIATPYLIIDAEFINALILAAKRGVDVRIVTPGIPDKKVIWQITKSFYSQLIEGGVKIYEYTPGFVHSKIFVADDILCTVGTINLDYRSLYLHFENGTYIFDSHIINDVKNDMKSMFEVSHCYTAEEARLSLFKRFIINVMRLFSPLL